MASLIAARSTTAGTPLKSQITEIKMDRSFFIIKLIELFQMECLDTYVKSCKITLAGLKGMSVSYCEFLTQSKILSTS